MIHKREKDYIFQDTLAQKKVGQIHNLQIIPYILFTIKIDTMFLRCRLEQEYEEWYFSTTNTKEEVSLLHLNDTYYNRKVIGDMLGDREVGYQIAYAIKDIYMNNKEYLLL